MSAVEEQLIALGAVFEAAVLVDRIARTGQAPTAQVACMLGSLLARNPQTTLEIYGGDDLNLRDGYRALVRRAGARQQQPATRTAALRPSDGRSRASAGQAWRHAAGHR